MMKFLLFLFSFLPVFLYFRSVIAYPTVTNGGVERLNKAMNGLYIIMCRHKACNIKNKILINKFISRL